MNPSNLVEICVFQFSGNVSKVHPSSVLVSQCSSNVCPNVIFEEVVTSSYGKHLEVATPVVLSLYWYHMTSVGNLCQTTFINVVNSCELVSDECKFVSG